MKACMLHIASRKEGEELAGGFGYAGNESTRYGKVLQ